MSAIKKKHYSYTQLNMYRRCPVQYYYRYKEGLKIPPVSVLTLGSSVHSGLEHNFSQKIESHKDLAVNKITEKYASEFDYRAKETAWEKDEKPGKIKDEGVGLLRKYHKEHAPIIQPVEVESEFKLNFANKDWDFLGKIDVIDDKMLIIDHKVTSRSPNEKMLEKDLQFTCYSMAYRMTHDGEEDGIAGDYLIRTKEPQIKRFKTVRTKEQINRVLKIVAHLVNAIEQQIFYPNEDNFLCSPEKCGYYERCNHDW